MAGSSSELGLHHTAEGLNYTRGRNHVSRAQAVARAGLAALALLGLGKVVSNPSVTEPVRAAATSAGEKVANLVNGPTQEQKIAQDLLKNAPENQVLTNIMVNGKDGANMRTKPATSAVNEPNRVEGEVRGNLERGATVAKAVPVWGSKPGEPMDSESKSLWFIFSNPQNPGETVFSWSGNFEVDQASVTPFELQNH